MHLNPGLSHLIKSVDDRTLSKTRAADGYFTVIATGVLQSVFTGRCLIVCSSYATVNAVCVGVA